MVVVAIVKDLNTSTMPYFGGILGFEFIDKEKVFNENFKPAVLKYCTILEKHASKSTINGFLFDSGITYADIYVSHMIQALNSVHPELMSLFQNLLFLSQRVFALPQLQNYILTRPQNQDAIFELIKKEFNPRKKEKYLTDASEHCN
uniref:GST C-terminal domain-containing protein n=1 Tax=Panagrolaimus sp. ES5 TaxID=591445 RepID=A0AC34F7W3_9BILA